MIKERANVPVKRTTKWKVILLLILIFFIIGAIIIIIILNLIGEPDIEEPPEIVEKQLEEIVI